VAKAAAEPRRNRVAVEDYFFWLTQGSFPLGGTTLG